MQKFTFLYFYISYKNSERKRLEMFPVFYYESNMDLRDLQIIAFCFDLHFMHHPDFFGIGVVYTVHTSLKCKFAWN